MLPWTDSRALLLAGIYLQDLLSSFHIAVGDPSSMPLTLPFRVLCATGISITRQGAPHLCYLGSWASNDAFLVDGSTCCDSNHCWWRLTSSIIGGSQAHHPRVLGSVPNLHAHYVQQTKATSLLLVSMKPTDLYRSSM